jgi:hypothetical protein
MNYEDIDKFHKVKNPKKLPVRINFKTRSPIKGIFIELADYEELRRKNLWRIVSEKHIESYQQSGNTNLARIFNGAEMTKLEMI